MSAKTDERSALSRAVSESQVSGDTASMLLDVYGSYWTRALPIIDKAVLVRVDAEDQVDEMKRARQLRLALREVRVEAEHKRKELKEESLRTGKAIDNVNRALLMLIEPVEKRLEEHEQFAERAESRRRAQRAESRRRQLEPYVANTSYYDLASMPDQGFDELLSASKTAHEARQEQARREQEEREAAAREREEEQRRVMAENNRLKAERDAMEREAADARRREQEARAEADRIASARAKEVRAQEEAERRKAEAERRARRRAAAAPDRQKLRAYAEAVRAIPFPTLSDELPTIMVQQVQSRCVSFVEWLIDTADSIEGRG